MPTGQSADDLDLRSRQIQGFRKLSNDCRIGRAVSGSLGDPDFELLPAIPAGTPAADPGLRRTWRNADRDLTLHHFGWSISFDDG